MVTDSQGFKVWTEEEKAAVGARIDALLGKLQSQAHDRKVRETLTRLKPVTTGDVTQPDIRVA